MRWAFILLSLGCGRRAPPGSVLPESPGQPDVLARSWYLKAAVSEARGDALAAERAHRWVDRLDGSSWPDVHRGRFLLGLGRVSEAAVAFQLGLAVDPGNRQAELGLGLSMSEEQPERAAEILEPLLSFNPCAVALSGPSSLRSRAERACLER